MGIIIFGILATGCLLTVYEKLKNKRQGKQTCSQHYFRDDAPRIIELPKDIEREKKRRHLL